MLDDSCQQTTNFREAFFGITLSELIEKYEDWRQQDMDIENITAGRLVTIKSQLKHLLAFKGSELLPGNRTVM